MTTASAAIEGVNSGILPSTMAHARNSLGCLQRVHGRLTADRVTIGWLHRELDVQATYLLIFVLALIGALPGASLPAGLAICVLSGRMLLSLDKGALPARIADREISARPARYAINHAISVMQLCRRVLPRFGGGVVLRFRTFAAGVLFVLGVMLLVPVPLSNVLPAFAAAILALALVEESLVLFLVSSAGALGSLAVMIVTVSAAGNLLTRL